MSLGPVEGLFFLFAMAFAIVPLGLVAWGVIDAMNRPDEEFTAIGQTKTLWVLLMALGAFTGIGVIFSIYYLAATRPKLDAGRRQRARAL